MSVKSQAVMKSQRKKKLFAVEQFGGKCQLCGYDKCINALSFHHVDPSTKKEEPSYVIMRKSWEEAFKELQKCILVCANCHAEIHYKDILLTETTLVVLPTIDLNCKKCKKPFQTKNPSQIYCGSQCKSLAERKVKVEPTKHHLSKLLKQNKSWKEIGKIYGVSDNTMRKWAKKFQLI